MTRNCSPSANFPRLDRGISDSSNIAGSHGQAAGSRWYYLAFALLCAAVIPTTHAWNALGHRLVAQIAYDNMTLKAKYTFNRYNHQLDKVYRPSSLINSAPWMDSLRYLNNKWLEGYHYIDKPFSWDGTKGKKPVRINAVWAIQNAKMTLLNNKSSAYDKGFSTRVLLHVIGDLHQPLHAASLYSKEHPKGDLGGNLFPLSAEPIGTNLHSYWDAGGGLIWQNKPVPVKQLQAKAKRIEKRWPCSTLKAAGDLNPVHWSQESHAIATKKVYTIKKASKPTKAYQNMAKTVSEKQIALAGCRLAGTLNQLVKKGV